MFADNTVAKTAMVINLIWDVEKNFLAILIISKEIEKNYA